MGDDVFENDEVPRTEIQYAPKDSAVIGSNINDGDLQNYRCRFCRIQFVTIEQLEEHQTIHITQMDNNEQSSFMPIHCKTCGKYFSSVEYLRSHEQNVHKYEMDLDVIKCLHCQKLISKTKLESHLSTEHKQIDYPITRHILLSNATTQPIRPFKCSICGRRTTTEATMVTHHQRFHSSTLDPSTTSCEVCNKLILTRNLKLHMTAVHRRGNGSRIKCTHCGRYYKSRTTFLLHMQQSHPLSELPQIQIVEDSLSSSSTTTQSECTPEDIAEYSNSSYQMNIESYSDQLNDGDEIISYGEVIPMNVTGTNS